MVTIGVAVAIPEPWAGHLLAYREGIGDDTARMIPTHITLVPPTELPAEDLALVEKHLQTAAGSVEAFSVHLRGTGTFRPVSQVVFVSLAAGISECELLAAAARSGPLDVDLTFPYHPHVTIAHDLADDVLDRAFDDLADFECAFDVSEFHLYVHDRESGWRPTRSFRLPDR